jgi:hypothetical protein
VRKTYGLGYFVSKGQSLAGLMEKKTHKLIE